MVTCCAVVVAAKCCGEIEEPDAEINLIRFYTSCASTKQQAAATEKPMDVLAAEPRLRVQSLLLTAARPERPIVGQQQEIFQLLKKKVGQSTIANRFGCSLQSISSISSKRMQLEKGLESGGSGHNEKSDILHATSKRYVAAAKRRTLDVVLVHALL